jgi:hypothetical protein
MFRGHHQVSNQLRTFPARYSSCCSFCNRQIIPGKHHISFDDKNWIHSACLQTKRDGYTATSEEDMGKGSCGICYSCIRLKYECIDGHKHFNEINQNNEYVQKIDYVN